MGEVHEMLASTGVATLQAAVPVTEVTLLEDRALVVRTGIIELPPGRSRLRIAQVAPVLVDKTLAAELSLPDGDSGELPEDLRVRSVSVRRWRVTREADRPANLADVRATRRAKQLELDRAKQTLERLAAERAAIDKLIGLTITELNEDVGWGRQERWAEQLAQLDAKLGELGSETRKITHQNRILARELNDLSTLEAANTTLGSEVTAELTLEFLNPDKLPRRLSLRVDYLVPGALWRPWHTARLIEETVSSRSAIEPVGGSSRVEFTCEGAVWQATGEDWTDVQLMFSTERPSLGVTPPSLATDTLRVRKKSATVEVESRDEKVHTAGLGSDDAKKREADELPGIDDGGEAIMLRGRVKATVPGDGRPYRVPIFSFESPAETALICAPELVPSVMLRSRLGNLADHALLAGPVDLVRNSGLVGRTSLLFIAPGERFELGWGPDASLRVHRAVQELEHEKRMMSSWTRKPRKVTVKLSNLSPTKKTIEVKERMAVSEIEKVEVEVTEASQGKKPDADGFVTWSVDLPGFGREELALTWVLVVHDDVVGL
jgi:uncharacterized protein (TIGR02231 family)